LNLTFEVREGIWKRRNSDTCRVFGYDREFDLSCGALLEAQVSDWSDGIAYDHHDLDDALKSGLIRLEDLHGLDLWEEASQAIEERFALAGPSADTAERVRRQELIRFLVGRQVRDLVAFTQARLEAAGVETLAHVRAAGGPLVGLSEKALTAKHELQAFLDARVYQHYRVKRQVHKGRRVIDDLFKEYTAHPNLLPEEYQEWVEREGVERAVCDYVAGMTDRYAQREHQKLFALFEPM
jgi:dGTPase